MNEEWKKCFRIGVTVFALFLCIHYWETFAQGLGVAANAAYPLVLGGVIAYITNILMSFYEKHYLRKTRKKNARKYARPVCMLSAFLTVLLIVVFVVSLVVPELVTCVQLMLADVPKALSEFFASLNQSHTLPESIADSLDNVNWNDVLAKAYSLLSGGISSTVSFSIGAVSSVVSSVFNFVIGMIFAIYLLTGKERLGAQCRRFLARYMRPAWNEKLSNVLGVVNSSFHKYIVGQCTEAVILGALCALGMMLFGFPYALMTGTVIGVTALIPIAGAYIGGAVGFLLILSVSPIKAVLFLIYLVVLQQLEGNLIYPRVVGSSIGLPGLWVLATVTIGGGVFGIAGMLLGVPLAAAAYQLIRSDMHRIPAPRSKKS